MSGQALRLVRSKSMLDKLKKAAHLYQKRPCSALSDPPRRSSSISADSSSGRSHKAVAAASVAAGLVTTCLSRSSSTRPSLVGIGGGKRYRPCARIFQVKLYRRGYVFGSARSG